MGLTRDWHIGDNERAAGRNRGTHLGDELWRDAEVRCEGLKVWRFRAADTRNHQPVAPAGGIKGVKGRVNVATAYASPEIEAGAANLNTVAIP